MSRGEESKGKLLVLSASPQTTRKFSAISIIPGIEPHCRKTDFLFREEERWGLARLYVGQEGGKESWKARREAQRQAGREATRAGR